MRNKEMKNNKKESKRMKTVMSLMTFVLLFWSNGFYSMAANIGENAGNWILDQLFWVGVVILAIGLIGCVMKKAYVVGGVLLVGGGIVLALINDPTLFSQIGDSIVDVIFRG